MNVMESFGLSGKVAIVTGGAGYLGASISEGLAEAGASVVIASRHEDRCKSLAADLAGKCGVKACGIFLDTGNMESVRDCMKTIHQEMGSIDILVNNAASTRGKSINMSEDDWTAGIEGVLNGVYRCIQAAVPFMENQRKGVILNIASMYGIVSPDPQVYEKTEFYSPPNYGAGKAAVIQLTRYLACHLAPRGIRVNAISPGPFPNPRVQKNQLFISNLQNKVPLGRIGQPEDLKGAVIFLSSEASTYITGHNLVIDGGWTVW